MMSSDNTIISKPYDFTVFSILKEAWQRTHNAKAVMWASMVTYLIASILILMIGYVSMSFWFTGTFTAEIMKYSPETESYKSGLEWIRWLILFPMHTGILLLAVRRSVDLPIHIKQVFGPYTLYLPLLVIGLLLFCLISLSKTILQLSYDHLPDYVTAFTIFDIFLTLFFSVWLTFAALLVIEKHLNIYHAIKTSLFSFKQHWLKILLILVFIVVPYFIIANVLLFTPTFMILGASQLFWIVWGILVSLLVLSSMWVIPMFLNIGGVLYRIMFGVNK